MTFTGDIGPRVVSDGLTVCMDPVSPKCREENNFVDLVSKDDMAQNLGSGVFKDGTHTFRLDGLKARYTLDTTTQDYIIENNKITVEALVNFEEPGSIGGFIGYNPYWPYSVRCTENDGVCVPHFRYQDSAGSWQDSYSSSANFPKNTWTHVCLTYDGVNAKTYINSELKFTKALNPTGNTAPGSFFIGQTGWTGAYGNFAFVRLYVKALTQQEISHNYNIAKRTRGVL